MGSFDGSELLDATFKLTHDDSDTVVLENQPVPLVQDDSRISLQLYEDLMVG